MKNLLSKTALYCLILAAVGVVNVFARHDDAACMADARTLSELKAAKTATAKFNGIAAAENAGYGNINLRVPNMGDHWVKFDLVDGIFEADKPEALVYADLGDGKLRLVAVEYLAPYVAGNPPAGFTGTCDEWAPFPSPPADPIFWTLHAWIWEPNLAGTFAKFNPIVP